MRAPGIRLGAVLAAVLVVLLVVQQFVIPPYLENRVANRLTEHGGTAQVELKAVPAVRLLFGSGRSLDIRARGLSVDLEAGQRDVFKRLDDFRKVTIRITSSRAGPFTIRDFRIKRIGDRRYAVAIAAEGAAGDVARYAAGQLAGGFGEGLAGLAASALGGFNRPIPVEAVMVIDTTTQPPVATGVRGDVAGLPAGPLAGIVANTLLGALD